MRFLGFVHRKWGTLSMAGHLPFWVIFNLTSAVLLMRKKTGRSLSSVESPKCQCSCPGSFGKGVSILSAEPWMPWCGCWWAATTGWQNCRSQHGLLHGQGVAHVGQGESGRLLLWAQALVPGAMEEGQRHGTFSEWGEGQPRWCYLLILLKITNWTSVLLQEHVAFIIPLWNYHSLWKMAINWAFSDTWKLYHWHLWLMRCSGHQ